MLNFSAHANQSRAILEGYLAYEEEGVHFGAPALALVEVGDAPVQRLDEAQRLLPVNISSASPFFSWLSGVSTGSPSSASSSRCRGCTP